ncbi:MAG TPA: hypothetical protein DCQ83_02510 [Fibrobacteres bacterium]|jgi:hypothetical protein|nr:hypothetical protein [Fibrobacterota bacterium]
MNPLFPPALAASLLAPAYAQPAPQTPLDTAKALTPGDSTAAHSPKNEDPELLVIKHLGRVLMVLKDGTMKRSCLIKEIHDNWIVYEKNGVLHDEMIDRILRLETPAGAAWTIEFDDHNKPRLIAGKGE